MYKKVAHFSMQILAHFSAQLNSRCVGCARSECVTWHQLLVHGPAPSILETAGLVAQASTPLEIRCLETSAHRTPCPLHSQDRQQFPKHALEQLGVRYARRTVGIRLAIRSREFLPNQKRSLPNPCGINSRNIDLASTANQPTLRGCGSFIDRRAAGDSGANNTRCVVSPILVQR